MASRMRQMVNHTELIGFSFSEPFPEVTSDDIISIKVDDSGAWTIGIAAAMQVSTN